MSSGRRERDQRAFDPGGEILGLGEAVRIGVIGRRGREPQHRKGEQRGGQVDERLERVGEQAHRTREPPGDRLERDRHDRRGDR